ncbi:GIY-YIG nuclease family protein [Vineibacter terrae]|uniref:GIY-YIG nuclease family protein n=1 Tax=Vineibacter terrae TaxID=2586908 RepID=UPI002E2F3048|nr:GIY-YIG nuclease family protein [Vineibacter terrae]HEX2890341.1 GIY-YIG nuclease family protein [Vineibacter terrae]
MTREHRYWVYVMTNRSLHAMYIEVTNDLERRVWEHRQGFGSEFARKYRVHRLVHAEEYSDVNEAIAREKQLKGWRRLRKNELVMATNPGWADLMPFDDESPG